MSTAPTSPSPGHPKLDNAPEATPKPLEPKLTRVSIVELRAAMQIDHAPTWVEAIDAVLGRHIGEVLAP